MSLKNIFIVLTSLLSLSQSGFCQKTSSKQTKHIIDAKTEVESLLEEVNSKFTLEGKPINPKIIDEFSGGADGPGVITSIDLNRAKHSNRYQCDSCEGKTRIDFAKDEYSMGGSFSYNYVGKTANNIFVVETSSYGGGSGIFGGILFLSVHIGTIINEDGEKGQQLIMNLEGSAYGASVGGGPNGVTTKITIQKNKVIVDYTTIEGDEVTKDHKEFSF